MSTERQAHGTSNGQAIHIEDVDATGAARTDAIRWVLAIGLRLAIVVISLVWISPALTA
ncbi:MAG: hypothetical protein O3C52_07795 [Proteobacteria bacterium]|nr:hypothetical protein [Pseudomonadota bacterium]MDA0914646.1 hypothetical protein [Pseudomonadota bacterium]MDA1033252.1 hypothetical protein [Pseudomonadota bacterium]